MLGAKLSFRWPQCVRTDLKKIIPSANNDAVDLITSTLFWDPKRRPTTVQVDLMRMNLKKIHSLFVFFEVFKTFVFQSEPRSPDIEQCI